MPKRFICWWVQPETASWLHLRSLTGSENFWKMMLGRQSFPFRKATFQGRTVKLQVGSDYLELIIQLIASHVDLAGVPGPQQKLIMNQAFTVREACFPLWRCSNDTFGVKNLKFWPFLCFQSWWARFGDCFYSSWSRTRISIAQVALPTKPFPKHKIISNSQPHRIYVWYISLHLPYFFCQ